MEPVCLPSRVTDVEVFRSGARVVRRAFLPDGPWPDEVFVDGLPLALEDDSVRVSVEGDPAGHLPWPGDVRVVLVLPAAGEPLESAAEQERRAADGEIERLKTLLARIEREEGRLDRIQPALPVPFANRPPRPAPAAAWRGAIAWLERRRTQLAGERLEAREALRRADEGLSRLDRRQQEERARRDAKADAVSKAVSVRLRDGGPLARGALLVEYQVPGAFWAPSYVVRVARNGRKADLAVRALVAQRSGEPWTGVALKLSTADRRRESEIPELPSLRIGRRQAVAPRPAWRPLPEGYEELFAGLDRALVERPAAPSHPDDLGIDLSLGDESDSADLRCVGASLTLPPAAAPKAPEPVPPPAPLPALLRPQAAAAPMDGMAAAARPASRAGRSSFRAAGLGGMFQGMARSEAEGGFTGMVAQEEAQFLALPEAPPPAPERLEVGGEALRYADLLLSSWEVGPGERGRLRRRALVDRLAGLSIEERSAVACRLREAEETASRPAATLPASASAVAASAGTYDTRYAAEGPVDVDADGKLHLVALFSREASVKTLLVAVPREGTDVVRVAVLRNPLGVPLLSGPADVCLEEELLVTSPLRTVPARGELTLGLGVEERLKVARKVQYAEESHGVLGGGLTLDHRVSIDVASRFADPVEVEVRERVPVKDESNRAIEISFSEVSPPWSDNDQAEAPIRVGKRWRLTLAPGETRTLAFRYQIRIDGKDELVGGNRRERG